MSKTHNKRRTLEAMYRRGYHHGFTQSIDLIFRLIRSDLPLTAVADLCSIFG